MEPSLRSSTEARVGVFMTRPAEGAGVTQSEPWGHPLAPGHLPLGKPWTGCSGS